MEFKYIMKTCVFENTHNQRRETQRVANTCSVYNYSCKYNMEEMGVVDDTRCIVRHNERDSIEHVFWKCDCIGQVWKKAINIFKRQM